ncbi:MAG: hypothetical protein IPO75_15415 [Betaproteobacteria bacterium]|nr:hypothetical protein [Betaproteobacteria bacterium]
MAEPAAGFVEHLAQRHLDAFEQRQPALPLGVGQSREDDFFPGRIRASSRNSKADAKPAA